LFGLLLSIFIRYFKVPEKARIRRLDHHKEKGLQLVKTVHGCAQRGCLPLPLAKIVYDDFTNFFVYGIRHKTRSSAVKFLNLFDQK